MFTARNLVKTLCEGRANTTSCWQDSRASTSTGPALRESPRKKDSTSFNKISLAVMTHMSFALRPVRLRRTSSGTPGGKPYELERLLHIGDNLEMAVQGAGQ